MSTMPSVPPNIFNAEFLNSPVATAAAWISIIGAAALVVKLGGSLFNYRKSHNKILKKAGIPAFILNILLIRIPLRYLPNPGWPERVITIVFSILFLYATYYFSPSLIQTIKTPQNSALLYWKKSGEAFFASKEKATAATISSPPGWTISTDDCLQPSTSSAQKYSSLTIRQKEDLCKLLTTTEGKEYLTAAIKEFNKDKLVIFFIVPLTLAFLLWLPLSLIFTFHYSSKVRKYILNEQKKAIHCAHGEFKAEGIYAIYQELERKTHC